MHTEFMDSDLEEDNKEEALKGDYDDEGEEDWTYREAIYCHCICHITPGVRHIIACCNRCYEQF